MVTITGFQQRKTADGKEFLVLQIEGGLHVQISETTGKPYATVAKSTLPCSFNEETARDLIGSTMPGTIVKEPCEPYSFINSVTNEEVTVSFRYAYKATETSTNAVQPVLKTGIPPVLKTGIAEVDVH
jgi:hypothetical protein